VRVRVLVRLGGWRVGAGGGGDEGQNTGSPVAKEVKVQRGWGQLEQLVTGKKKKKGNEGTRNTLLVVPHGIGNQDR